jgi:hypothetical protein
MTHTGIFTANSAKSVSVELLNELNMDNMIELDLEDISVHYGFNPNFLDDFSVYTSSQEGNANEIAIFVIENENNRQQAFDAIVDKLRFKSQAFSEINIKEYDKFSSNTVTVNDSYIIVAVSSFPEKVYNILDNFYK